MGLQPPGSDLPPGAGALQLDPADPAQKQNRPSILDSLAVREDLTFGSKSHFVSSQSLCWKKCPANTFSRAGGLKKNKTKNPTTLAEAFSSGAGSYGSLRRQVAVVLPEKGWLARSLCCTFPLVFPTPPRCGRPRIWKGNSHCGSIWDLERDCDAALSEGINLSSFFRTSPTCLLLNVRVMGSASDKTAYYS